MRYTCATPEEATVYTNIVPATPRKRTHGGDEPTSGDVPAPAATLPFVLDADQGDDDSLNMGMARTFTGAYIGGVSGTFTCADGDTCTDVTTATTDGGQRLLSNQLSAGWTFESDEYDESVATQERRLYVFRVLAAVAGRSTIASRIYQFSAFFGGGTAAEFTVPSALTETTLTP